MKPVRAGPARGRKRDRSTDSPLSSPSSLPSSIRGFSRCSPPRPRGYAGRGPARGSESGVSPENLWRRRSSRALDEALLALYRDATTSSARLLFRDDPPRISKGSGIARAEAEQARSRRRSIGGVSFQSRRCQSGATRASSCDPVTATSEPESPEAFRLAIFPPRAWKAESRDRRKRDPVTGSSNGNCSHARDSCPVDVPDCFALTSRVACNGSLRYPEFDSNVERGALSSYLEARALPACSAEARSPTTETFRCCWIILSRSARYRNDPPISPLTSIRIAFGRHLASVQRARVSLKRDAREFRASFERRHVSGARGRVMPSR